MYEDNKRVTFKREHFDLCAMSMREVTIGIGGGHSESFGQKRYQSQN